MVFRNTTAVDEHKEFVRERIRYYTDIGALEMVTVPTPESGGDSPRLVHPLHIVLRDDRKPRLVLDLSRNLNAHLPHQHVRYQRLDDAVAKARPNCWFAKLDISDCYLSFPLAPHIRHLFVFAFEGQHYRFVRMPFGLAPACAFCEQLMGVVSFELDGAASIAATSMISSSWPTRARSARG